MGCQTSLGVLSQSQGSPTGKPFCPHGFFLWPKSPDWNLLTGSPVCMYLCRCVGVYGVSMSMT